MSINPAWTPPTINAKNTQSPPLGQVSSLLTRGGTIVKVDLTKINTTITQGNNPAFQGYFKYVLIIQCPAIKVNIMINPPNGELYEIDQLTYLDFSSSPPKGLYVLNDATSTTQLILYLSNFPISNLGPTVNIVAGSAVKILDAAGSNEVTVDNLGNLLIKNNVFNLTITGSAVSAPQQGKLFMRIIGTGNVATMQINVTTENLNQGVALVSGAWYEFVVHVAAGDTVTIGNATFNGAFLVQGS